LSSFRRKNFTGEEYEKHNNEKALETLLAYSAYDAVDLEALMILAYNLTLEPNTGDPARL
jgi:uncharacterized protein YprB with RNaseH-like and TPR domain